MNREISAILLEIAQYLAADQVPFKPQAYRKAARALEDLGEDAEHIYAREGYEGLERIPGVGESIAALIEEYLRTGKVAYHARLKKKFPSDFKEIVSIEGMGPKRARILHEELGIRTLDQLKKEARAGKIASLPGFGTTMEKNILEGIEFLKRARGRFPLAEAMEVAGKVKAELQSLKGVTRVDFAGSLRRKKETVGDVDILVCARSSKEISEKVSSLPGVEKVWGKGETKISVHMREGFDIDVRVIPPGSYGAALQYFTGSKEHNIQIRKIAISKGFKLSEYGLFRGSRKVAGASEEEVYEKLGMRVPAPELREGQGEIEAALEGALPDIIPYGAVRGDLHCHSDWDGGENSLEEIAKEAYRLGYAYIGISDHTKFLKIERGLDEKQLARRNKEIDKMNAARKGKKRAFLLKGAEVNILADGSLDIRDKDLAKLDYVIAGVHSQLRQAPDAMTSRLTRAMRNPHVDIIAHPTGRLIGKREEYAVDMEELLRVARETGTALEINASPERLDLKDLHIRRAKEAGVKMVVNTDAHRLSHLHAMEIGIAQARRGWAERGDILNTESARELLSCFHRT